MLAEGRCWLVEASHHDDSSGEALGRDNDRLEQVPAPIRPVVPPGWGPFPMEWARTAAAISASLVGEERPHTWRRSHNQRDSSVRDQNICSIHWSMTDRPRLAQREPRSLQPEQLGQLPVCTSADPWRVYAWVLWEDGVEELVQALAFAWTRRAVRVRFGAPPHQHEVWVWAGAVERAEQPRAQASR